MRINSNETTINQIWEAARPIGLDQELMFYNNTKKTKLSNKNCNKIVCVLERKLKMSRFFWNLSINKLYLKDFFHFFQVRTFYTTLTNPYTKNNLTSAGVSSGNRLVREDPWATRSFHQHPDSARNIYVSITIFHKNILI